MILTLKPPPRRVSRWISVKRAALLRMLYSCCSPGFSDASQEAGVDEWAYLVRVELGLWVELDAFVFQKLVEERLIRIQRRIRNDGDILEPCGPVLILMLKTSATDSVEREVRHAPSSIRLRIRAAY